METNYTQEHGTEHRHHGCTHRPIMEIEGLFRVRPEMEVYYDAIEEGDSSARAQLIAQAKSGDADKMFLLAYFAELRGAWAARDKWLNRAAAAGSGDALTALGFAAHMTGRNDEAIRLWSEAVELGHAGAMFNMGAGPLDSGDMSTAKYWFERAAKAGDLYGMQEYGTILIKSGNIEEGQLWLSRAAEVAGEEEGWHWRNP